MALCTYIQQELQANSNVGLHVPQLGNFFAAPPTPGLSMTQRLEKAMTKHFNHAVIYSPINTSVKTVVLRTETLETTQNIKIEIKKMNVNWPCFTGIILDER